jgi:molybdenum cofactor biosynthesis enzyme MoaA
VSGGIGVSASVMQAFCHGCRRIRLTTDGKRHPCLFAANGVDLPAALRDPRNDSQLSHRIVDSG